MPWPAAFLSMEDAVFSVCRVGLLEQLGIAKALQAARQRPQLLLEFGEYATHGSFISHSFEFAPHALGTQFPYIRYYLQYFKYFPLTRPRPVPYGETPNRSRLVFATGTRIGLQ